jgi:exonuclease III
MATPMGRCRSIAATLQRIDADVVALQEVESLVCLRWFRDTFLAGMGYTHLASIDAGYHRGVECSVLSRIPIVESSVETGIWMGPDAAECCEAERTPGADDIPFRRPPLRLVLQCGDDRLALFVMHHKAGGGKANTWRREAEACHTVKAIAAWRASRDGIPVILAGDFNAMTKDCSVQTYLEAGMSDVMHGRSIPTHESGRTIDYVMMSDELLPRIVPGTARVIETPSPPAGWNWKTDRRPDWSPSDHRPVMVDIRRTTARSGAY